MGFDLDALGQISFDAADKCVTGTRIIRTSTVAAAAGGDEVYSE